MRRFPLFALALALAASAGAPLVAQVGQAVPQPLPYADTIPAPRDIPYPGTIRLEVNATDTTRGIFQVTETIPVAQGRR